MIRYLYKFYQGGVSNFLKKICYRVKKTQSQEFVTTPGFTLLHEKY